MLSEVENIQGFILVNKPVGLTSFQVVKRLRYLTGVKKIGHAGTLDPFATGLLIVAIGKPFTKQLDRFQALSKTYTGVLVLGITTDTYDCEGTVISDKKVDLENLEKRVSDAFKKYVGKFLQTVPKYSAKKHNGVPGYKLARKGKDVPIKKTEVEISYMTLDFYHEAVYPTVGFSVGCSKGTYIRSLVYDIGEVLICGAHVKELVRTKIGEYALKNAIDYEELTFEKIKKEMFLNGNIIR